MNCSLELSCIAHACMNSDDVMLVNRVKKFVKMAPAKSAACCGVVYTYLIVF